MKHTIVLLLILLTTPPAVFGASISAYTTKATPVGTDKLLIADSADSWKTKSVLFSYFAAANNPTFFGTITVPGLTGDTYTGTNLIAAIQAALTALDGTVNASPFMLEVLGATDAAAARTTLGIGNINNTADVDKPVSTAVQAALNNKQNAVTISTSQPSGGVSGDLWIVVQ